MVKFVQCGLNCTQVEGVANRRRPAIPDPDPVNVPAHHGIHFRITQQDRTQHMRVAQAVLIEPVQPEGSG